MLFFITLISVDLYIIKKKMCYILFYLIGTWWLIYTNFIFNKTKKFSVHLLFHSLNQTQMKETKIFSI